MQYKGPMIAQVLIEHPIYEFLKSSMEESKEVKVVLRITESTRKEKMAEFSVIVYTE